MPNRFLMLLPVAIIALTPAGTPAHAKVPVTYEEQAVAAANDVRVHHGLHPLRATRCLKRLAEKHARRMARRGALSHQPLGPVLRRCRLGEAAENVAVGHLSGRATVQEVWMESPGHRANILTRSHRLTGVGAFRDASGQWWTVQLLGRR